MYDETPNALSEVLILFIKRNSNSSLCEILHFAKSHAALAPDADEPEEPVCPVLGTWGQGPRNETCY